MKLPALGAAVGAESEQTARQLSNLGVTLDVRLTLETHTNRVCLVSYFQLKTIWTIQNVLTPETRGRLVHAFVTARLDYCNSTLVVIQNPSIQKLQLLQNFRALHWLLVRFRVHFTLLILSYKAQIELAPWYVCRMLAPRVRLKTFAHRSFQYVALKLWNHLPEIPRNCSILSCFQI